MNTILNFLRRCIYVYLGILSELFGLKPLVTIYCYHGISDDNWVYSTAIEEFTKQMKYLSTRYDFISVEQVERFLKGEIKFTKPSVLITFDDGYADLIQLKDLVRELNMKPLVFLVSDQKNINYECLGTKKPLLAEDQIKTLISGGWDIGSHGATHSDFSKLSTEQLKAEIVVSKKALEDKFGQTVKYISYPKGKYTKESLDLVKDAGYRLGFSMDDDFLTTDANFTKLPRVGIVGTHTFEEFKYAGAFLVVLFRKFVKNSGFSFGI